MNNEEMSNLKLAFRAINLALPMLWLIAMTVWGFVWRVL